MSDVVFPEELLYFVESLRPFQIHEVGSKHWLDRHEMVIKLSQQATLEAATHREECVKELLILHDKLKVLIHEAYCILLWKTKVLPHLLDIDPNPQATFLIYTVLFHEGSVIALLDIALYHQSGCESLKETSVDLVDYCAQAVSQLIGLVSMGYHENETNLDVDESILSEMERQKRDMLYKIGLRCISILNYLAMNLNALPISAVRRMVTTHDIPWLLADLLNFIPWQRKTSKGVQKYIDETWTTVSGDDMAKVVKHEAQTWFCLRQLLFNTSLMEIYELNDNRRKRLAQCHGLLHDTLLDQLPPLAEFKHYLCTLGMSDTQSKPKANLMLEELPQIKEKLIIEAEKNGCYLAIAQKQADIFLTSSTDNICELAQRLNTAYNTDFLAEMEGKSDTTKTESKHVKHCEACKKEAEKKCSQCKQTFYCSRECQLKDWPDHKNQCMKTESVVA